MCKGQDRARREILTGILAATIGVKRAMVARIVRATRLHQILRDREQLTHVHRWIPSFQNRAGDPDLLVKTREGIVPL
jgi:hypothetical protein